MFETVRPATRIILTALLLGCLALQALMPMLSLDPALHGVAIGVFGFVVGTVTVSILWLVFAVPNADVRPGILSFLLLVATMGPGFAVILTWLFGDDNADSTS